MKNHARAILLGLAALVASGLWSIGITWSQAPGEPVPALRDEPPKATGKVRVMRTEPGSPYGKRIVEMVGPAHGMHEIRRVAEELVQADDDESKAGAEKKLNRLLNEYFDADMERREQELADVEARVKKLRGLLERRRENRDDIIELQIRVLRNEAEGLGFFNHEMGPGVIPGVGAYPQNITGGGAGDYFRLAVPPPPGPQRGEYRDWYGYKRRPESKEKKPPAEPGAERDEE